MDWMNLLQGILYAVITGAIGLLTTFATLWIKQKMSQAKNTVKTEEGQKYLSMLEDTVINCVVATNQTYVSNLKKENLFDAEAQKKAFDMTYQSVMSVLNTDAQKFLSEAYTDVPALVTQMIEAQVNKNK